LGLSKIGWINSIYVDASFYSIENIKLHLWFTEYSDIILSEKNPFTEISDIHLHQVCS
jgi:hypothetical protein